MRIRPLPRLLLTLVLCLMASGVAHADAYDAWHAKAQKAAQKAESVGAKRAQRLEQKLAALDDKISQREQALAGLQQDRPALQQQVATHHGQLEDALDLPDGDPAKTDLVKAAQQALAASQKALAQLDKQIARLAKQLAKLAAKRAKTEARRAEALGVLEQAQMDLSALSQPFAFGGVEAYPLELLVAGPDGPLAGAFVSVHTPLVPPKNAKLPLDDLGHPGPWFSGRTDADGRLQAEVSLPTALTHVDVSVHVAGLSGPFTHEALRETLGVFAPSARLIVSRLELDELALELAPTPQLLEGQP